MATTEMPESRHFRSRSGLTLLLPFRKPPPWIDTRTGVGFSDLASQTSMTFLSCGPYLTFSCLGRRSWAKACDTENATRIEKATARFMTISSLGRRAYCSRGGPACKSNEAMIAPRSYLDLEKKLGPLA